MNIIIYNGYGFMYNADLKHYDVYAARELEDELIGTFSELTDVYNFIDLINAGLVKDTWYKDLDKATKQ
jgi:hypothetical protein